MEDFIYENNVDGMRARDLRNLLVQKLGVSQDLVNRVLDRTELKEMVTSIVYRKLQDKSHDAMMQKVYITTAVVGVLTVLYMCRKFIFGAIRLLYSTLSELSYKSAHKLKLVVFNAQNRKFTPAFVLSISLFLEVLTTLIHFSILLGWFVPHGHVLRKYFIPTFSFPVSAGALLKAGTGGEKADRRSASVSSNTETSGGIGEAVSNFSLDIGPMITIAVLNFVINRLDEYAAGVVLENVKDKDEKRAFKKFFGGKKKPRTEKDVAVAASQDSSERVHAGDTANRDSEYVYVYGESKRAGGSDSYGASQDERDGADSTEPTPSTKPSHTSGNSTEQANDNKLGNNDGFDLSTLTSAERPEYVTHQAATSDDVYASTSSQVASSKENDGEGWLD